MIVELDENSKDPPYVQIKSAITRLVTTGELPANAQLPTIRQLAGDLDLAPNTVARAYRELEVDGLIRSRGRRGTIVSSLDHTTQTPSVVSSVVSSEANDFIRRARSRGLDTAAIVALLSQALARGS
jgi:GntR family transcriptional regulator